MAVSLIAFLILLALVGATRLWELRISRRHQLGMTPQGIKKVDDPQFRWMVMLHALVLAGAAAEAIVLHRPFLPRLAVPMAALFVFAVALRWWAIRSLGKRWNVEVMASAPMGVCTSGPFRWVRHPNYVGVSLELVALPLIHTAWVTALIAACGNTWVLYQRLSIEEPMLNADPAYRAAMAGKPRFLPKLF